MVVICKLQQTKQTEKGESRDNSIKLVRGRVGTACVSSCCLREEKGEGTATTVNTSA